MRIAWFCHSLISDWNNGHAHFLRGVVSELLARRTSVRVFEPEAAWSADNLLRERGPAAIEEFEAAFPHLRSRRFDPAALDLDEALDGVDLVVVHEWNEPELIAAIGHRRARGAPFRLLFHDTHHRSVSDPEALDRRDLSGYDGVLAFGDVVRDIYLERSWAQRAWTWHEAADTRVFKPEFDQEVAGDLVWIGNWGDDERTRELTEFLLDPVRDLRLRANAYGVRYPDEAIGKLARAGVNYRGWIANYRVPRVFARHSATVHVPRRPYAQALLGIPTIRVFEALACAVPLIAANWQDSGGLFRPGHDFLVAHSGTDMKRQMKRLLGDAQLSRELSRNGLAAIRSGHTCAHRVDELLRIAAELGVTAAEERVGSA